MGLNEARDILLKKGFTETTNNEHGSFFVNDDYKLAILFTNVYLEDSIDDYNKLRDDAKQSNNHLDTGYFDKSTILVFNETPSDLDDVINDPYDFIKSSVSILYFLPNERKKIILSEMGNPTDTGDLHINPYSRFCVSSFIISLFKQVYKTKIVFNLKYPPIMDGTMELAWLKYWSKKISI